MGTIPLCPTDPAYWDIPGEFYRMAPLRKGVTARLLQLGSIVTSSHCIADSRFEADEPGKDTVTVR